MIWYKDEQYAPTEMNQLRYITQQIQIDGLRICSELPLPRRKLESRRG
jgi:hypothetical protein